MMTALPPILKFSALSLPIPVGLGALLSAGAAGAAAIVGVVMVLNIAAYAFAGPRFLRSLAASEGGGIWGPLLLLKSSAMLLIVMELAQRLPAEGVALGLCPLFLGAVGIVAFARPDRLAAPQEV